MASHQDVPFLLETAPCPTARGEVAPNSPGAGDTPWDTHCSWLERGGKREGRREGMRGEGRGGEERMGEERT